MKLELAVQEKWAYKDVSYELLTDQTVKLTFVATKFFYFLEVPASLQEFHTTLRSLKTSLGHFV